MIGKTILIVDDEAAIREMIRVALELSDFGCLEAEDIKAAHGIIIDQKPDLVLLDWMLPGGNGIELLRRLRRDEATAAVPVVMLTAKADEDNKVQGLDVGADDYIIKPFAPRELIARVKALLRRIETSQEAVIEVKGLRLDPSAHRVFVQQSPVDMGPTEFRLLKFFMLHPERAYSRAQLLDMVWGGNVYVEERTVDVHIRRLRKALQTEVADLGGFIQTVRGTGYRFSTAGVG